MVIFDSYVKLPEGNLGDVGDQLSNKRALQTHLTDGGLLWRVQKDLGTVTGLDPRFAVYPVYPQRLLEKC